MLKNKNNIIDELEEKYRHPRKKKTKMKISGASVKKIAGIIRNKRK